MRTIHFTKMHSAGNDYIYVYGQDFHARDAIRLAPFWCDRHKGIGADGIVIINPSHKADFKMEMFNADGSQGMMCGNAARCIGSFVASRGYAKDFDITLETASGIKFLHIDNEDGSISVNMGRPAFADPSQFLPDMEDVIPPSFRGSFVSMGNPHYVIFVEDMEAVTPEVTGMMLEHAACFPAAANIEFAQILGEGRIRMRVWERGSGVTLACGTGACATAVAAISRFGLDTEQTIIMDGGSVKVDWGGEEVTLTGDAVEVYSGTIDYKR
ncbi:MAG: diaminopimelate epimerase [Bacteroidales bacterium]|nr:diaminopimelate epimerase [Bacteroidales bacterium]MBO7584244.1 diaminopimelate epimerase [Bacteroidales bacterium]